MRWIEPRDSCIGRWLWGGHWQQDAEAYCTACPPKLPPSDGYAQVGMRLRMAASPRSLYTFAEGVQR